MTFLPISDYGLIGNSHGAALVGKNGSIDWCCMPRFDSPSIFAALLHELAGCFTIAPQGEWSSSQRYISDTNVLETRFETAHGVVIVTDCMPLFESNTDPSGLTIRHQIVRMVRCASGKSTMDVTFNPMLDYGILPPHLTRLKNSIVARFRDQKLELLIPLHMDIYVNGALGVLNLVEGDEVAFVLAYSDSDNPQTPIEDPGDLVMNTAFFDQAFAYDIQCDDKWREPVVRSALALLAMTYFPSGGIVAAPTTSLPGKMSGAQNRDYRFTWIRNASFAVDALNSLGETTVALWFFEWLCRICQAPGEEFENLYRVDGTPDTQERELTYLGGYRNLHPVRIGNRLGGLPQLSIYGEVLASAYLLLQSGQAFTEEQWELLQWLANQAAERWAEPDNGMWEDSSKPLHFVHSKVMCWVALDRAIKLGKETGHLDDNSKWESTAEAIKAQVLERGWNEEKQTFVHHYDTDVIDASNLLIPLVGFLPDDDPRVVSTVACIQRELQTGTLIYRYRLTETNGGITNDEGASMLCSFWFVRVLARQGKSEEARKLFTDLLEYGNELGLFSEMVDPATGEALGNFPHAMTHLALVLAARDLG